MRALGLGLGLGWDVHCAEARVNARVLNIPAVAVKLVIKSVGLWPLASQIRF